MPPELALVAPGVRAGVPRAWRTALAPLALAWLGLIAVAWRDWADMAHQWWDISTYNHILLIPPILAWLVWLGRGELARLSPHAWWPGLAVVASALVVWLAGFTTGINLIGQLGAVMLLQAAALTLLGPRAAVGLAFPLAYMLFLVPFGDEIVPALQYVTAEIAIALTHASGVPATIDGVFIDTPAGLFEVAEACSGVKFLVAMTALGALVSHVRFLDWRRRAIFMAVAIVLPILANGVRAWGTIYIAQSQGIAFAAGFDHIVYGWVFFGVVVAVLLAAAWPWFDRALDDPLLDAGKIEGSLLLESLSRLAMPGWAAAAGIVLSAAAVALIAQLA